MHLAIGECEVELVGVDFDPPPRPQHFADPFDVAAASSRNAKCIINSRQRF